MGVNDHNIKQDNPLLKAAAVFFVLNALLFLPHYILSIEEATFFPSFRHVESGNLYSYFKLFFIRENLDFFRLSADFLLLVILGGFLHRKFQLKGAYLLVAAFFIFFLFFQFYSAVFQILYGVFPMVYNDWSVLKTGFMIVYQGFNLSFVIYGLALILGVGLLVRTVKLLVSLTSKVKFTMATKIGLGLLVFALVVNLKFGTEINCNNTIQYQSLMVGKNLTASYQAKSSLSGFSAIELEKAHHHELIGLRSKPNLYFISVESYGKLMFTHDSLKQVGKNSLLHFQEALNAGGYNHASNYSISPVMGGLSWIAYSNFSFGFNFKNQGTYNALLEDRDLDNYTDLFKVLKVQGYTNYRLMPLYKSGKIVIPWDKYSKFYRVDQWIKYEDLNYSGELYGFGPSVPDQYALNYTKELMDQVEGPKTLFFLTVSSHNPFLTPALKKEWRSLNETDRGHIDGANLLVKPSYKNYGLAIDYELRMLSEFIINNKDSNAIYVLFGDHQPPFLANADDGMETPMHIVSKNQEFIKGFKKYGFEEGGFPKEGSEIRHEAFLSMFLTEFQVHYGDSNSLKGRAINYLSKGIKIR